MTVPNEDIIDYILMLINDFAEYVGLNELQAYLYLKNHNAISFIENHYNIMHTLSEKDTMENLIVYCRKFGGSL